ncbi:MAG: RNA chaperone Hfq [Alphaproteobacteria bacterium 41-28]|nr:MAG: RNA chaperone Hfq [Alphaproteobacteria bacterium 41-28]
MTLSKQKNTLQYTFLNKLRKEKVPVTIFLINGVKLEGIIPWFDSFSVLLRRGNQQQLIYKHAISTVFPINPIPIFDEEGTLEE